MVLVWVSRAVQLLLLGLSMVRLKSVLIGMLLTCADWVVVRVCRTLSEWVLFWVRLVLGSSM